MAQGRVVLRESYGCPIRIGFRDMRTGTIYSGSMVAARDDSDLIEEPTVRTDLRVMGICASSFAFVAATDRERRLQVDTGVYGPFANSAGADEITSDHVDQLCYVIDGNTVALTSGSATRSPAGYIRYVLDGGGVVVDFTHYESIALARLGGGLP